MNSSNIIIENCLNFTRIFQSAFICSLCIRFVNIKLYLQCPSIICGICETKGHIISNCPEDKFPEVKRLPPVTKRHLILLSAVVKTARGRYSIYIFETRRDNRGDIRLKITI